MKPWVFFYFFFCPVPFSTFGLFPLSLGLWKSSFDLWPLKHIIEHMIWPSFFLIRYSSLSYCQRMCYNVLYMALAAAVWYHAMHRKLQRNVCLTMIGSFLLQLSQALQRLAYSTYNQRLSRCTLIVVGCPNCPIIVRHTTRNISLSIAWCTTPAANAIYKVLRYFIWWFKITFLWFYLF